MNILTMNAVAITLLAAFGLWAFQAGMKKQKKMAAKKGKKF